MSVHYKFKSALDFDTIAFDGLHISVSDLKKAIIQQKRLGKTVDFDLQITNAQTKEEYTDEGSLIPKNTSLIIARIPLAIQPKKPWDPSAEKSQGARVSTEAEGTHVDLSRMNGTEEDKINAMMMQSTLDYDPNNYQKIRGSSQTGEVPHNYRCYKCHKPGHWIKNCPLGPSAEPSDIKRNTGIPRSFIEQQQNETAKLASPPLPPPIEKKQEIPDDLICSICKDLFTDAVMIPCCGSSFCDDCVRTALLESEDNECPDCHEKGSSPGSLIPNRFLRNSVNAFRNETGYNKPRQHWPKPKIVEPPPTQQQIQPQIQLKKVIEEVKTIDESPSQSPLIDQPSSDDTKKDLDSEDKKLSGIVEDGDKLLAKEEVHHEDKEESDYEDNITVTVPPAHLQSRGAYRDRQINGRHLRMPRPPGMETPPKPHYQNSSHQEDQRSATPTVDEKEASYNQRDDHPRPVQSHNLSSTSSDRMHHSHMTHQHQQQQQQQQQHQQQDSQLQSQHTDPYGANSPQYPGYLQQQQQQQQQHQMTLPNRSYEGIDYMSQQTNTFQQRIPYEQQQQQQHMPPYHGGMERPRGLFPPMRGGHQIPPYHMRGPRHIGVPVNNSLASVYQGVAAKVGTGIIDDPLEAFNRIMREKERLKEERRRSPHDDHGRRSRSIDMDRRRSPMDRRRSRNRSPDIRRRSPDDRGRRSHERRSEERRRRRSSSYSSRSSRSRSRSLRKRSRTPRKRSRSPMRRTRSRTPSFSVSRSRSRSITPAGRYRGPPPSRFIRSPPPRSGSPRHRFKDNRRMDRRDDFQRDRDDFRDRSPVFQTHFSRGGRGSYRGRGRGGYYRQDNRPPPHQQQQQSMMHQQDSYYGQGPTSNYHQENQYQNVNRYPPRDIQQQRGSQIPPQTYIPPQGTGHIPANVEPHRYDDDHLSQPYNRGDYEDNPPGTEQPPVPGLEAVDRFDDRERDSSWNKSQPQSENDNYNYSRDEYRRHSSGQVDNDFRDDRDTYNAQMRRSSRELENNRKSRERQLPDSSTSNEDRRLDDNHTRIRGSRSRSLEARRIREQFEGQSYDRRRRTRSRSANKYDNRKESDRCRDTEKDRKEHDRSGKRDDRRGRDTKDDSRKDRDKEKKRDSSDDDSKRDKKLSKEKKKRKKEKEMEKKKNKKDKKDKEKRDKETKKDHHDKEKDKDREKRAVVDINEKDKENKVTSTEESKQLEINLKEQSKVSTITTPSQVEAISSEKEENLGQIEDLYADMIDEHNLKINYPIVNAVNDQNLDNKSEIGHISSPPNIIRSDSVLDIHANLDFEPDLDEMETDVTKKVTVFVPLPEPSKWERDDENQSGSEQKKQFFMDNDSSDDKSGKVTNEVLKRAENALFSRAINAIRPIEIRGISADRRKLYSNETNKDSSPVSSVVIKAMSSPDVKDMPVFQITVPTNSETAERSVEIKTEVREKLAKVKISPVRTSIKDRLGSKITEPRQPHSKTPPRKIIKIPTERERSRSKERNRRSQDRSKRDQSPSFGRNRERDDRMRTYDRKKDFKLNESKRSDRRYSRDRDHERRQRGPNNSKEPEKGRNRSKSKERDMRRNKDHVGDTDRDRARGTERSKDRKKESDKTNIDKRSKDVDKEKEREREREREREKEKEKQKEKDSKRTRSRSLSADHKNRKDKKHKKEREDKRKQSPIGDNKNVEKSPIKSDNITLLAAPQKAEDESGKELRRVASIDRKRLIIDEANFVPDYDEQIEQEIGPTMNSKAENGQILQLDRQDSTATVTSLSDIPLNLPLSTIPIIATAVTVEKIVSEKPPVKSEKSEKSEKKRAHSASSSSSSDSSSSSSDSDTETEGAARKRKKRKHKKQKRSKRTASTSDSGDEAVTASASSKKVKKNRKKSSKSSKKKKRNKHK